MQEKVRSIVNLHYIFILLISIIIITGLKTNKVSSSSLNISKVVIIDCIIIVVVLQTDRKRLIDPSKYVLDLSNLAEIARDEIWLNIIMVSCVEEFIWEILCKSLFVVGFYLLLLSDKTIYFSSMSAMNWGSLLGLTIYYGWF